MLTWPHHLNIGVMTRFGVLHSDPGLTTSVGLKIHLLLLPRVPKRHASNGLIGEVPEIDGTRHALGTRATAGSVTCVVIRVELIIAARRTWRCIVWRASNACSGIARKACVRWFVARIGRSCTGSKAVAYIILCVDISVHARGTLWGILRRTALAILDE